MGLLRNRDFLLSLLLFGFNIFVSWEILNFPASNENLRALGPDVFPWIINIALYVLSGLLLLKSLPQKSAREGLPRYSVKAWLNMGLITVFCILFIPAMEYANFLFWGIFMMFCIQYALGERRIFYNLLFSIGFPVLIYLIFVYGLNVALA